MFGIAVGTPAAAMDVSSLPKKPLARLGDRVKLLGCLADAGFYRIELIQYFEARALEYVLAAPLSQVLQRAIYQMADWQKVDEGIEVAEFPVPASGCQMGAAKAAMWWYGNGRSPEKILRRAASFRFIKRMLSGGSIGWELM